MYLLPVLVLTSVHVTALDAAVANPSYKEGPEYAIGTEGGQGFSGIGMVFSKKDLKASFCLAFSLLYASLYAFFNVS